MFCVIEIALTVLGISILITTLAQGRFPVGTDRELRGGPAYIVGGLLTAVLPVALIIACGVVGNKFAQGREKELENDDDDASYLWIDIVAIAACGIPAGIVAAVGNQPKRRKKKKKKRRIDDDYDDYDRPVRRRRRDEEEEEEEQRAGRAPDPDEEERPRRRRSAAADDEDAPPRRRRLDEDDDDDFRPRRRRRDDDD